MPRIAHTIKQGFELEAYDTEQKLPTVSILTNFLFLTAMTKKKKKKKRFSFGSPFENIQSIIARKYGLQEHEAAALIVPTMKRQRDRDRD